MCIYLILDSMNSFVITDLDKVFNFSFQAEREELISLCIFFIYLIFRLVWKDQIAKIKPEKMITLEDGKSEVSARPKLFSEFLRCPYVNVL